MVKRCHHHDRNGRTTMPLTTYGVDIAKRVFQVHWVEAATGEVHSRALTRPQVTGFFVNRPVGTIALEACGSGHYWARTLAALGHEVRLLHPKYIRPFVRTNKNDAADAEAIWTAAHQPGIRLVAVKNEEQQAVLGLHRMREQLVKFRTMQVNQVRGLLNEFGFVFRNGRRAGLADIRAALAELEDRVPGVLMTSVHAQLARLEIVDRDVAAIERQMQSWQRRESDCQRLVAIPGIGPITATALVASIGNAKAFRSGREFAAFLGLVPRQSGTGGRVKLLGISKRGDSYLRKLLVHGARTVLFRGKTLSPWMRDLLKRRHRNVATVALANKMARIAWALMAHERSYHVDWRLASAA
jgi:transposase